VHIVDLEQLDKKRFIERFGGLYEHSPWVAELAWERFEQENNATIDELRSHLQRCVNNASDELKLTLLRAHPELAGKAAIEGSLTHESTGEQASARLDQCSKQEFERFHELNAQYNEKFGFPFILAVRNKTRVQILEAFEQRIDHTPAQEFDAALEQVHQIASLRLNALENVEQTKEAK